MDSSGNSHRAPSAAPSTSLRPSRPDPVSSLSGPGQAAMPGTPRLPLLFLCQKDRALCGLPEDRGSGDLKWKSLKNARCYLGILDASL